MFFCMHSLIIWCRCLPTCFQRFKKVCCDAVCFSNKVYHSSAFELWWDCRISYIFSRWFWNVSCSKSLAAQFNLQTMVLEFISADITIEVHSFCRPLEHRHGLLINKSHWSFCSLLVVYYVNCWVEPSISFWVVLVLMIKQEYHCSAGV